MATVSRIACPKCSASCIDGETNCWQCSALLKPPPPKPTPPPDDPAVSAKAVEPPKRSLMMRFPRPGRQAAKQPEQPAEPPPLIRFDPEHVASSPEPNVTKAEPAIPLPPRDPEPPKRVRVSLTGEVIEDEEPEQTSFLTPSSPDATPLAASIGSQNIEEPETEEVMTLTFCRNCGYENEPGKKECAKCGKQLEVIAVKDYKEIEALPRAWGFDILGAIWIILGIAAIFAGQFLVQTDANRPPSAADYLWTGVVAVAPGVLVIMRHHFCRTLFWTMTVGSVLIWGVVAIVWWTGHLHVSDKGEVGLSWLFALSCLSAISFFLVRTNDAFDYDIGVWLGRQ